MSVFFLFGLFFLCTYNTSYASEYYLAPNGSNSGDGTINNPWHSLNYALNKYANDGTNARVRAGDTLYLRGGVYDVTSMSAQPDGIRYVVLNTNPNSPRTYIKSRPGEWAVLDGGGTQWSLETRGTQYNVTFEDMEIRNGYRWGFRFGDGYDDRFFVNGIFRNLYFHDNTSPDVNHNPAGMQLSGENCIVEYCTFEDNGTPGASHHNSANLILYNRYYGYPEPYPRRNNTIRYCVFIGSASQIKDKGDSNFVDNSDPNKDNIGWANEIHHNVFRGALGQAYYALQDFMKFHNNLVIGSVIGFHHPYTETSGKLTWWNEIYNNTFVGMSNTAIQFENNLDAPHDGAYGHDVHSNIIYDCTSDAVLLWTGQSSHNYAITSDYNFWHNNVSTVGRRQLNQNASLATWRGYGYGNNSATGKISFIDPTNNDYRLAEGSIGKNAGKDAKDAGAFGEGNWYIDAGSRKGETIGISPPKNLHLIEQ